MIDAGPSSSAVSGVSAWEAILDTLEASLQDASRLVHQPGSTMSEPAAWLPPETDGPLPRHLVPRVSQLLGEFERVQLEISRAMGARRSELSALARAAGGVGRPVPAYVDISA